MQRHEIAENVRRIINEQFMFVSGDADLEREAPDEATLAALGADDLDAIETIMVIEEDLEVELDEADEFDNQTEITVGQLIGWVEAQLG
ncbi:putative acyl carrier protein [Vibrio phage 207E48.1]|nr:putative acyl carrier protein [Vibrio phage 207E48.1]